MASATVGTPAPGVAVVVIDMLALLFATALISAAVATSVLGAPQSTAVLCKAPTTRVAAVMLLRHLGEESAAARIEKAVSEVLKEGKSVTADMKPSVPVGTTEMTAAIVAKLT